MAKLSSLTIFFPCYNDARTIGFMVAAADETARQAAEEYEILVINDASPDDSAEVLTRLGQKYPRLRVITHPTNRGYGGALRTGFAEARCDFIFYTDGDAQFNVYELIDAAAAMNDQVDAVCGYKISRGDQWRRKFIGRSYVNCMRMMFTVHVRDINAAFKLVRRRVLEAINLTHDTGVIALELVKKMELTGANIVEYPVTHYPRFYGQSQFMTWPRVLQTFRDIFRLRLELLFYRRTHRPIRIPGVRPPESNPTVERNL